MHAIEPVVYKTFKFYTYDRGGKDVIVPIEAANSENAWKKFHRLYSAEWPVDMVVEA
jgi:hypothetical protein